MKRKILILILCFITFSIILPSSNSIIIKKETREILQNEHQENTTLPLIPGDIAFKHPDITPDWFPVIIDHCLLFIEYNCSTKEYVFIEANQVNQKVQYRNETRETLTGPFWGPFGRVRTANPLQKQNAIDFAKRQIGKTFQNEWINKNYNFLDTSNDSYANTWYCSELIWAAYYNCNNSFSEQVNESQYIFGEGIDLDKNKWSKEFGIICVVRPKDIANNRIEIEKYTLGAKKVVDTNFFTQFFSPIFLHVIQNLKISLV